VTKETDGQWRTVTKRTARNDDLDCSDLMIVGCDDSYVFAGISEGHLRSNTSLLDFLLVVIALLVAIWFVSCNLVCWFHDDVEFVLCMMSSVK
jgi:hypothetical protein